MFDAGTLTVIAALSFLLCLGVVGVAMLLVWLIERVSEWRRERKGRLVT